jgi:hypothetical protein
MKKTKLILFFQFFFLIAFSQFKYKDYTPIASREKIDSSFVMEKSSFQLKIIRNEVFAYHGFIFNSPELRTYFNGCQWYKPESENVDNLLSDLERENIDFIINFEKTGFVDLTSLNAQSTLSTNSYFKFEEKDFISKSVTYEDIIGSIPNERPEYIIQKIEYYDENNIPNVDGTAIRKIELNIFETKENKFTLYKHITEIADYLTVFEINDRLIYESEYTPTGSGNSYYKLVDIEDNFAFLTYGDKSQCFELKGNDTRWISANVKFEWYDEREISFIRLNNIRYQKVGSIVYSDFNKIYQILDIYKPQNEVDAIYSKPGPKPRPSISLEPKPDNQFFIKFLSKDGHNEVILKEFTDFNIIYHYFDNEYKFSVIGDSIDISNFRDDVNNLYVKIRSIE